MQKILLVVCISIMLGAAAPAISASGANQLRGANDLFAKGKYQEALQAYQTLLNVRLPGISEGMLYTRIADSYFHLEEYAKAHAAYRAALDVQDNSDKPQTQYWIGFCMLLMGKHQEAVAEFLKIPEQYPDSGMWVHTAYYWAGRVCERMGNKELASKYFLKAGGAGKSVEGRFALEKAKNAKNKKAHSDQ
ncbi:MAG: tetratricopeptide repeat protein [Nitrospirota bacterium]